ncbi:MAG TPA: T9SS type A sorting domain-containing protein, partial [Tenuifilaceae bacterium]|nr:T9SS type A sorting domain-containing protein [Tenuifilaceae bacterium]
LDKNNSPLSGATITLGTTTNPPDDYDFVVEPGTYSYSVQLQDYYAEEGNVTVTNQNVTVNVIMTHVGIEDNTLSQIKVYPIPFEDYLIITGIAKVSRISIANLIGSNVVINDNLGNDRMFLSTEKLSQGVYLMTFYLTSGERVVKKVVKR